jgi:hypothetical protein
MCMCVYYFTGNMQRRLTTLTSVHFLHLSSAYSCTLYLPCPFPTYVYWQIFDTSYIHLYYISSRTFKHAVFFFAITTCYLHTIWAASHKTIEPCHTTLLPSGVPRNFFSGGVQQIQLRTEGRENGDLGAGSPLVRGSAHYAIGWHLYSD